MSSVPGTVPQPRVADDLIHRGLTRAREGGRPALVSQVIRLSRAVDGVAAFRWAGLAGLERTFWSQPAGGLTLVGIGRLHTVRADGRHRYAEVRRAWQEVVDGAAVAGPSDVVGTGPVLLGGFAFDEDPSRRPRAGAVEGRPAEGEEPSPWAAFGGALFHLPRLLLTVQGSHAWMTVNTWCHPSDDPGALQQRLEAEIDSWQGALGNLAAQAEEQEGDFKPGSATAASPSCRERQTALSREDVQPAQWWYAAVRSLTEAMRGGTLRKVVLARQVRLRTSGRFDVDGLLARLRVRERDAHVFALEEGDRCFLGASPERLVRLSHGRLEVDCLAGTIRRGECEDEDRYWGERLLQSGKDRREHATVLEMLREALQPFCVTFEAPSEPKLLKTPSVQHLHTPVRGRVIPGTTVFSLVEALHPTPAVCGTPRGQALEAIRRVEPFDRGWYAGPVGWVDARGDGEFCVALRSGLVFGQEALLFAGCGIMPDSDPDSEYQESCLKLRTMLAAFQGES